MTISAAKKTLSYWQLASVSIHNNLCQKCFNKHLQAIGEKQLTNVQWRQVVERKRIVENDGERTICTWDVGIFPPRKKQSKEVPRVGRRRKAGRNSRSMAAGITSQRVPGTSENLP